MSLWLLSLHHTSLLLSRVQTSSYSLHSYSGKTPQDVSLMPISLCSRFAASSASLSSASRDGSPGICIREPALAARFGRSSKRCGRATIHCDRRLVTVHAGAKRTNSPASSTVIGEPDSATSETTNWGDFAASVSGEWDGYSAEFNMFGEPFELPSNMIPDAFREWGQLIHDWQTQCPTLAHPEKGHFWYKVMQLHPTVGCEADAATVYSVEKADSRENASALAYHKGGSYTAVWHGKRVTNEKQGTGPGKEVSREGDEIEVEQCLVHEKRRIRVLQKLGPRRHVLVFREGWEGPFRNGESLGGCAVVTQAFATQKALAGADLTGKWNSEIYTRRDPHSQQDGYSSSELIDSGATEVVERTLSSTFLYLYLPKDTWTLLSKTESGGTTIETGWLVQPDLSIVSKCEIGSSGELTDVSLRVEKRISNEVAPVSVSAEEIE